MFPLAMLGGAEKGRAKVLSYMLHCGVDVDLITSEFNRDYGIVHSHYTMMTITSCAATNRQQQLFRMLVQDFGAEINNAQSNPLHLALEARAPWEYLLALGSDINFLDWTSTTPLISATQRDQPEQCEQLIRLGASLEARDF